MRRGPRWPGDLRDHRRGREKLRSIPMRGACKHLSRAAAFHDAAPVHHHDLFRHIRDHAEIMCDEDHRHAGLALQIAHQAEHLRLCRYIECRGRFIRDQQFRLGDHRHGDHGALTHAARHLERVAAPSPFGIGKADLIEHFQHPALRFAMAHAAVDAKCFRDLRTEPVQGRKRAHGFLKDHRDAVPPHLSHAPVRQRQQIDRRGAVPCGEADGTAVDRRCLGQQPQHAPAGQRLARSAFAHQRQCFAPAQGEADILYHRRGGAEPDCQVIYVQQ